MAIESGELSLVSLQDVMLLSCSPLLCIRFCDAAVGNFCWKIIWYSEQGMLAIEMHCEARARQGSKGKVVESRANQSKKESGAGWVRQGG